MNKRIKSDIDKFFKRLKRNAHKARWYTVDGDIRTETWRCPITFLAKVTDNGDFGVGSYWGSAWPPRS